MGTKANADSALDTDNRPAILFVKINNLHNTFLRTGSATDTFLAVKLYAAACAGKNRFAWTNSGTRRIQTATADIGGQFRLQSAPGTYLNGAVARAEAFVNHTGTSQHTRITRDTAVHPFSLQNFIGQSNPSLN
jgi:hypothetical protein